MGVVVVVVVVADDDLNRAVSVAAVQDICVVVDLDNADQDIVVVVLVDVSISDCHGLDDVFSRHDLAGHKANIFVVVVNYVGCAAWQG